MAESKKLDARLARIIESFQNEKLSLSDAQAELHSWVAKEPGLAMDAFEAMQQLVAIDKSRSSTGGTITVKVRPLGESYVDGKGETRVGKGNVLVYGLQRMPVTLYPAQWQRLLDSKVVQNILDAIEENKSKLAWK